MGLKHRWYWEILKQIKFPLNFVAGLFTDTVTIWIPTVWVSHIQMVKSHDLADHSNTGHQTTENNSTVHRYLKITRYSAFIGGRIISRIGVNDLTLAIFKYLWNGQIMVQYGEYYATQVELLVFYTIYESRPCFAKICWTFWTITGFFQTTIWIPD